jgi:hypothetical protein
MRTRRTRMCIGMAKSLVSFMQMCGTRASSLVSRLNSTGWIFCGCVGLREMVSTIQDGKPIVFHDWASYNQKMNSRCMVSSIQTSLCIECTSFLLLHMAAGHSDYTRAPLVPGPSITSHPEDEDNRDWNMYYINM